jgi:hypothetical protein
MGKLGRLAVSRTLLHLGLLAVLAPTGAVSADINIAPYCTTRSSPYVGASISYLTDGRAGNPADNTWMLSAPLPIKSAIFVRYDFLFPGSMNVKSVRLLQHARDASGIVPGYRIEADIEGDGLYDKTIVVQPSQAGSQWRTHTISPPIAARALRYRSDLPDRQGLAIPAVEEIEILSDSRMTMPRPAPVTEAPLLGERTPHAAIALRWPQVAAHEPFARGVFGSMWLFWEAGNTYSDLANLRHFALLNRLGVNRYWLYPQASMLRPDRGAGMTLPDSSEYRYFVNRQLRHHADSGTALRIMPFPSKVVAGYAKNVLGELAQQMHRNGIRLIANELLLPYGVSSWDFPRVANTEVYPCVLSSPFVREASTQLYRELIEAGADGIALGGDEFFHYGHTGKQEHASSICRDAGLLKQRACEPTCEELFHARYGAQPQPHAFFSPQLARWKLFEYERLGELFAGYSTAVRAQSDRAIVTSLLRAGEENRPAFGVAYDILGWQGGVSEMGSNPYWSHNSYLGHYYFANETKKLAGASRERKAVLTLQATPRFDPNGYSEPLLLYGPAFSSLMHGAKGINFYKHDYLFAGGLHDAGPWVEKFFRFTAVLDEKGMQDYTAPKTVALLYSRASEDWWQLRHRTQGVAAAEAILYHSAVMEVLLRYGVPFDLFFLDQPASLDALADYALLVLPYPYAVTEPAVARIGNALQKGARAISLRRTGEVNEFGEPHRVPLLRTLPQIERLEFDLAQLNYQEFGTRLMATVTRHHRLPLRVDAGGKDVECAIRSARQDYMLFCLNWESDSVSVNLGLRVAPGAYTASILTLDEETPASLPGKTQLSDFDLENFSLRLPRGGAQVVHLRRAGDAVAGPGES